MSKLYANSILPCGQMNVKTGNTTELGNVLELWDDSATIELWKKNDGKIVAISTFGKPTATVGNVEQFEHDQTQRPLFSASFVAAIPMAKHADVQQYVDTRSVRIYCYK